MVIKFTVKHGLSLLAGIFLSATAVTQTDETRVPIACPSADFGEFFKVFQDNENVQRTFTKIPLVVQDVDVAAEPEPRQFIHLREYDQIKYPLFLSAKTNNASFKIIELSDRQAKIKMSVPDTGWLTYYFFSMDTGWRLVLIDDQST
jgi:hypothetical protein